MNTLFPPFFSDDFVQTSFTTCVIEYNYTQVNIKKVNFYPLHYIILSICHALAQIGKIGGTPLRCSPAIFTQYVHVLSFIMISHIVQVLCTEAYCARINGPKVFSTAIIIIAGGNSDLRGL